MLDILIKNARILDGTGNPWQPGDVAIQDGRIAAMGRVEGEAAQTIDAAGLFCTPGFIDPHGHDEGYALTDEETHAKLSQGVTTDVSGNCGLSLAPVSPDHAAELAAAVALLTPPKNLKDFSTFDDFLRAMEARPHAINLAYQVGHGALRIAVTGMENRPATAKELDAMCGMLREALQSGAVGMSVGMLYPPGNIATQDELVALCRILRDYDRIMTIHIRDEADRVVESVKEAIDLARLSGCFVNISHHKALGLSNWGKVDTTLGLIEEANAQGVAVGFDQYPYNANCTGLNTILPPSYLLTDQTELVSNLRTKEFREQVRHAIMNPTEIWDNYARNVGMDRTLVIKADATPEAVGIRVSEYAAARGLEPLDAAFQLLADNNLDVVAVYFSISDEDIATVMRNINGMFGSDGIYVPGGKKTHPRIMGTMPRVLGHYVREKGVLRLDEAVRKMTSLPARRMRLARKGLLLEGYDADIVLFDAATVTDTADFIKDSYAPNQGIRHVIVNGRIAMTDNIYTGAASGRVYRAR